MMEEVEEEGLSEPSPDQSVHLDDTSSEVLREMERYEVTNDEIDLRISDIVTPNDVELQEKEEDVVNLIDIGSSDEVTALEMAKPGSQNVQLENDMEKLYSEIPNKTRHLNNLENEVSDWKSCEKMYLEDVLIVHGEEPTLAMEERESQNVQLENDREQSVAEIHEKDKCANNLKNEASHVTKNLEDISQDPKEHQKFTRKELEHQNVQLEKDHLQSKAEIMEKDQNLNNLENEVLSPKSRVKQDLEDIFLDHEEEPTITREELERQNVQLEKDRGQLAAEILEKDQHLNNLEREVSSLKAALSQREEDHAVSLEESQMKYKQLQEESNAKINELKRQFNLANHDKESMVMKYALGENEVIKQRKLKEEAEKKLKSALKEKEDLNSKLKTSYQDKSRSQQLADSRLQDINVLKKEIEKWKEDVRVSDAKTTVAGAKWKEEIEAHKKTKSNLEETIQHLSETRQEIEITRKECAEFMNRIKFDDEAQKKRSKNNEIEQSAKLIIDASCAKELEQLKVRFKSSIDENNVLAQKVQKMEVERHENAEQISKLKEIVAAQKQEINELLAQVAEMESLRMQLQKSEEKCESKTRELEELRSEAKDLNLDMTACRNKEAELLEFTQKLTDRNVILQSDLATLEAKSNSIESQHSRLSNSVSELKTLSSQTKIELEEEKKKRTEEVSLMAKKLAEKSKQCETLTQQTLDAENEVRVMKRKNAANMRELTRELQSCKKRLEEFESRNNPNVGNIGGSSRASSSASLESSSANQSNGMRNNLSAPQISISETGDYTTLPQASVPDSQKMLDKIISLQRTLAKKHEKIEFLEEHVSNLMEEVQKKNRIFQNYVMGVEAGALASAESDRNKRKMSETGGIMATLYSSKPGGSGDMSIELSLEINKKLQAVLEDTLLKNITLKENINTLGQEIAKMSMSKSSSAKR